MTEYHSVKVKLLDCLLDKWISATKDNKYNCTKHRITRYSSYFLLFGRHPNLSTDITLSEHQEPTNEQSNYNNFIQTWKAQMKEIFRITEGNTKKRRSTDKKQRDLKATLEPLKVGGRALVRNLTVKRRPGKICPFWEQKIYQIKEKKDKDSLVYPVVGEGNPKSRVRVLHRNHLSLCEQFSAFTDGKSYRKQQ